MASMPRRGGERALAPLATLQRSLDSLTSQPQFRNAHWGVLVVNPATGDTLFSKNAGKLFMPASNMKIITGAVSLALLGADYRYRTTFVTSGTVQDSVLTGDLVVIGRGDPSLSDRMRGNAAMAMDSIADSLLVRGVRRVTGQVARMGNAFPDSTRGYGWEWDDLREYYGAGVDELTFNESMAPTTLRADSTRDSLYSGPAPDPARAYLAAFSDALKRRGIVVDGGIADTIFTDAPLLDTLFVQQSPPLRDILPMMMKPSQNQMAELLFKAVGLERGGMGTADTARRIVGRQLLAWGAEADGFNIRDGSGLSRHNLLSPETVVRTLAGIQRDTAFAAFYNSMPIAGVDGTVRGRMKGTPAEGNVRAKTGSISFARSLSGYVTTIDGERLIFSVLANNWTTASSEVTGIADQVAALLAGYRLK